ncbi:MAG: GNAT family N-acetyltransferase [Enterobacteriaceae bacterium]
MILKPYQASFAAAIARLFYLAVHNIADSLYSPQEKAAWAPWPPDEPFWAQRLQQTQPWVALLDEQVVGFIEYEHQGYIDCLYTHPDYQRRGVATALLQHITQSALHGGTKTLYTHASKAAVPFFSHHGFHVMQENQVLRHGTVLVNYLMQKALVPVTAADSEQTR